jgi:tRNA dimethylallyltransferase
MSAKHEPWYLTGPTASGKTSVGIELAQRLGAEIVSMDSMALFRGMDIGTAKPTADQRSQVPHHLVDLLDPHQDFSLAQYLEAAGQCSAEIANRGHQVLFVGGTPLYLKGLLRGVFEGPPADWGFRNRLLGELQDRGADILHTELLRIDPEAAARIHPNDTRRLVRALEVYRKTGQPISKLQRQFEVARSADMCRVFVLAWDRAVLCSRIDQRVEEMFAAGLVDETAMLLARKEPPGRTALQAVGYREVAAHVQGKVSLAEAIELVKRHTRQLAKRQMTWFRSLSECRFVPMAEPFDAAAVAERIAREGTGGGRD